MSILSETISQELLKEISLNEFCPEESGVTIVHCRYVATDKYVNGGWINIWPSTYLQCSASGDTLDLMHAIEIPLAPERHYFRKAGQVKRFTLVFPKVPEHWECFDFREQAGFSSGFIVEGIQRSSSGVYHIHLV
jgi:hypothetical protein